MIPKQLNHCKDNDLMEAAHGIPFQLTFFPYTLLSSKSTCSQERQGGMAAGQRSSLPVWGGFGTLGGITMVEEACHLRRQSLGFHSLTLLPVFSLLCVCCEDEICQLPSLVPVAMTLSPFLRDAPSKTTRQIKLFFSKLISVTVFYHSSKNK